MTVDPFSSITFPGIGKFLYTSKKGLQSLISSVSHKFRLYQQNGTTNHNTAYMIHCIQQVVSVFCKIKSQHNIFMNLEYGVTDISMKQTSRVLFDISSDVKEITKNAGYTYFRGLC